MTESLDKIKQTIERLDLSGEDKKVVLDFLNSMPPAVASSFMELLKKDPLYVHRFLRSYYLKRAAILTYDGELLEKIMREEQERAQSDK